MIEKIIGDFFYQSMIVLYQKLHINNFSIFNFNMRAQYYMTVPVPFSNT